MQLADRTHAILPSATLKMAGRAKEMQAQGKNILNMSAGEPDFDTPDFVKDAAVAALKRGETKYTPVLGTVALRKAIAARIEQDYGIKAPIDQIIVGTGGKQVLFNAIVCLLNPGDEAVFGAPYWVSYVDMVRFAGGNPVVVPCPGDFLLRAADMEKVFTPKTRLLIISSPSNPAGAVYSRQELQDIAALLRNYPDIFVITDDIYSGLTYDEPFASLLHVAPDLVNRVLIATGVSKTYAMTGWRIGYGIGPKPLIAAMDNIQAASTSGACSIAQAAAHGALTGDQKPIEQMVTEFRKRRDRMVNGIQSIPNVTLYPPKGAFYVFPKIDAYFTAAVPDSQSLSEYLLEKAYIATVPGSAFGLEGYIRLSFACSDADIDEAIVRLQKGLLSL
jgi:aspartate aminotransferase